MCKTSKRFSVFPKQITVTILFTDKVEHHIALGGKKRHLFIRQDLRDASGNRKIPQEQKNNENLHHSKEIVFGLSFSLKSSQHCIQLNQKQYLQELSKYYYCSHLISSLKEIPNCMYLILAKFCNSLQETFRLGMCQLQKSIKNLILRRYFKEILRIHLL